MSQIGAVSEASQFIKLCRSILDEGINISPLSEIREEIVNDKNQMTLYGEESAENLLYNYKVKLSKVRSILYDQDKEQFILNILEFLKFAVADEEYVGIPGILFYESLDNYPYTSLLLGKGTSYSQASLFTELLNDPEYGFTEISRTADENPYITLERYNVVLKGDEYIDPYHYSGSKRDVTAYHYNTLVQDINFSEEKRQRAKEKVTSYLIGKLKIREISKELKSMKTAASMLDRIIAYIKGKSKKSSVEVKYHVIEIEGMRIESSRLLELFLIANSIPYTIEKSNTKENSKFYIDGNQKNSIDINKILEGSTENKKVFKKTQNN